MHSAVLLLAVGTLLLPLATGYPTSAVGDADEEFSKLLKQYNKMLKAKGLVTADPNEMHSCEGHTCSVEEAVDRLEAKLRRLRKRKGRGKGNGKVGGKVQFITDDEAGQVNSARKEGVDEEQDGLVEKDRIVKAHRDGGSTFSWRMGGVIIFIVSIVLVGLLFLTVISRHQDEENSLALMRQNISKLHADTDPTMTGAGLPTRSKLCLRPASYRRSSSTTRLNRPKSASLSSKRRSSRPRSNRRRSWDPMDGPKSPPTKPTTDEDDCLKKALAGEAKTAQKTTEAVAANNKPVAKTDSNVNTMSGPPVVEI